MRNPFAKPSAAEQARQELEESRRQLLAWETEMDNARSRVTYFESKIRRLTNFIAKESNNGQQN